jgi:hypothetical protein
VGRFRTILQPAQSPPRERPTAAAEAGEVPAVRLSLHVDAAGVGTLLSKGRGLPQRRGSPGTLTLGDLQRFVLGLPTDSESASSREKLASEEHGGAARFYLAHGSRVTAA